MLGALMRADLVVALVPVLRDVFGADHDGDAVWVHVQEILGQIDGDHTRAAAHAGQVVVAHILPQLELVNDLRASWRERANERTNE